MADYDDQPPALPADVPRVREGGLPTEATLDREHYADQWFRRTVTDLSTRITTVTETTGENTAAITNEATTRANEDEALAQQIVAVEANFGSAINAAVESITTAYTNADEALAEQITTVAASVGPAINAKADEITTAYTTADEAIASDLEAVSTTVGANTASLTTLAASVNGISVQFGVFGTINNVTGGFVFEGIQRLDGSVLYAIEFSASSFVLSDPNLPGGYANVFEYSTDYGAFRFNVPVIITNSLIAADAINDFDVVPLAAQTLASGAATVNGIVPGSSITFEVGSAALLDLQYQINFHATGAFSYPVTAALIFYLDSTPLVTLYNGNNSGAAAEFRSGAKRTMLAAGTYTLSIVWSYSQTTGPNTNTFLKILADSTFDFLLTKRGGAAAEV